MSEIKTPHVAVDAVLFTIDGDELKVLLIKLNNGPYSGSWCIPGGLVGMDETLDEAAKRVLFQKANVSNVYLEQLYTFGDLNRDSRSRTISVAYFALVNNIENYKIATNSYYSEIKWFPIKSLPNLAFDHKEIIRFAHERLKGKIEYTNIAYGLLPKLFTLTQMQKVHEIILGEAIDKRNFRKKILSVGMVKESNEMTKGAAHRPAQLYEFANKKLINI